MTRLCRALRATESCADPVLSLWEALRSGVCSEMVTLLPGDRWGGEGERTSGGISTEAFDVIPV